MTYSVHTYVSRRQHGNGSGGEAWAARPTVGLGVNTGQTHRGGGGGGGVVAKEIRDEASMIIVCNAYAEVMMMLILKTIVRSPCAKERHHGHDLHVRV